MLGTYQAYWTARIQEEWQRNLLEHRPQLRSEQVRRVERLMNQVLPGAARPVHEETPLDLILPDADDVHVVLTARQAGAGVIVTANLRDFSAPLLEPYGIAAWSPDPLLLQLLEEQPRPV